jgi:hypothetical protein
MQGPAQAGGHGGQKVSASASSYASASLAASRGCRAAGQLMLMAGLFQRIARSQCLA